MKKQWITMLLILSLCGGCGSTQVLSHETQPEATESSSSFSQEQASEEKTQADPQQQDK